MECVSCCLPCHNLDHGRGLGSIKDGPRRKSISRKFPHVRFQLSLTLSRCFACQRVPAPSHNYPHKEVFPASN